jgi:hypothetical protein
MSRCQGAMKCTIIGMYRMNPEYLDPDLIAAADRVLREEPEDEEEEDEDDDSSEDDEDSDEGYSE